MMTFREQHGVSVRAKVPGERPTLPPTYYVRWSGLLAWMREWGCGEWTVRRMIREGRIKRHFVGGEKLAKFVPGEIEREVFGGGVNWRSLD